ncbi:hypothetical protein U9M48_032222 [Paspalum notatum var. saurae]|uniref:Uncharacterized protein n=1 Tax=Paspalum notatum var. saurae TaxID=547442 RepID=A0AAQ3U4N1_PASNO
MEPQPLAASSVWAGRATVMVLLAVNYCRFCAAMCSTMSMTRTQLTTTTAGSDDPFISRLYDIFDTIYAYSIGFYDLNKRRRGGTRGTSPRSEPRQQRSSDLCQQGQRVHRRILVSVSLSRVDSMAARVQVLMVPCRLQPGTRSTMGNGIDFWRAWPEQGFHLWLPSWRAHRRIMAGFTTVYFIAARPLINPACHLQLSLLSFR